MTRIEAVLAFAGAGLLGCTATYPGESLGSFHVTGHLEENTCGLAVPAVNPMTFDVELRLDRGAAYWRREKAPLVLGTAHAGEFWFDYRSNLRVASRSADGTLHTCNLSRAENVHVELSVLETDQNGATPAKDTGEANDASGENVGTNVDTRVLEDDELALDGENSVEFSPVPGSDCATAVASQGGAFAALPCSVQYVLFGEERASF